MSSLAGTMTPGVPGAPRGGSAWARLAGSRAGGVAAAIVYGYLFSLLSRSRTK